MACDVQAIKTAACESGIALETNKIKLLQIAAQLLCEVSQAASGGSAQSYTGSFTDPTGNVTPDDPTIANTYYQDINPPLNVWYWSVADQAWHQHSG